MGKHYPLLPPHLVPFIKSQEIFYVATAPLAGGESGHVNVSPKGIRDSFWIGEEKDGNDLNLRLKGGEDEDVNKETKWIDEVWYDDLTGSGCETVAHLREEGNGRITIMFCAFEGPPNIVRIYGIGESCMDGYCVFQQLTHISHIQAQYTNLEHQNMIGTSRQLHASQVRGR